MAKKKYSASERKAFHMGRAFAVGKSGGRVTGMNEKEKDSFRNGVKAARGKKPAQANCGNCGAPLLIVDGNGVVVGTLDGGNRK